MTPFRIKICGITNIDDARSAAEAGADAIGLNFYSASPRFVATAVAREIAEAVRGRVQIVGVFVGADAPTIARTADELALDLVQLSGNDPPEFLRELRSALGETPVMQAVRAGAAGIAPLAEHFAACRALGCVPELMLFDAFDAAQFGGTGRTADWSAAAACAASAEFPPLILAGGLRPANIREAIAAVRPAGVDTASGVERSPGRKDAKLVAEFVAAARDAFDNRLADD